MCRSIAAGGRRCPLQGGQSLAYYGRLNTMIKKQEETLTAYGEEIKTRNNIRIIQRHSQSEKRLAELQTRKRNLRATLIEHGVDLPDEKREPVVKPQAQRLREAGEFIEQSEPLEDREARAADSSTSPRALYKLLKEEKHITVLLRGIRNPSTPDAALFAFVERMRRAPKQTQKTVSLVQMVSVELRRRGRIR